MPNHKVHIRFEGKTLSCRPDTSVAVALWENGVRRLSCSPKYGRPRGVTCARGHCTACLMRVDGIPNVRTCELPVAEGMDVRRQDAGAFYAAPMQKVLTVGSAFFPVGFYYKWFTRPPFVSRLFLDGIRPLTGIGRLPDAPHALRALPVDPDTEEQPARNLGRFATVVVGAGPAGLAAAAQAAGPVLLIDDHPEPGGQRHQALQHLAAHSAEVMRQLPLLAGALERSVSARAKVSQRQQVTFRGQTKAVAGYHPDGLVLRHQGRLQTVRFDQLVWAAGALDTLGLFPGNDTCGLLGPRALYRLLIRDGLDLTGQQVLVCGGGFDFWLCAALLEGAGARVSLVLTGRENPAEIATALDRGWQLTTGLKLDRISARGPDQLRARFSPLTSADSRLKSQLEVDTDCAVVCGRGKPAYDIPYQLGADLSLQPEHGGFLPRRREFVDTATITCDLPGGRSLLVVGEAAGQLPGSALAPTNELEIP